MQTGVGVDHSHRGLRPHVAVHPQNRVLALLAEQGIVVRDRQAWGAIVRVECPDRVFPRLSREARSQLRVHDAAAEEQVDRRLEVAGVLQEERPPLRKEDLETLVHRHLGLVRLHLAEVRVCGQVEDQAVPEDSLEVQAAVEVRGLGNVPGARLVPVVERSKRSEEPVGDELHVPARGHVGDSQEPARLVDPALDLAGDVGPERPFVLPADPPTQDQTPLLALLRRETEALEGNGHPDDVALGGQRTPGIPDRVERLVVEIPVAFDPGGISLNTERVDGEDVRTPLVVEGVQEDVDHVVAAAVFPARHPCPDLVGLGVEADEDDVQVRFVIAEVGLGPLGGGGLHREAGAA